MLKLKVLIIDDSPVIREMVKDSFIPEGFEVIEAENGEQALKIAWDKHPDLIIADIKMPGINGWEVCSQIRKHPVYLVHPFHLPHREARGVGPHQGPGNGRGRLRDQAV